MAPELPRATRRFVAAAAALGLDVEPVDYPDGTRTAADAAAAIGCDVAAILKSLVFMVDEEPVLVLMSGDLRVDEAKVASETGGSAARRATLDEVRDATGYVAGGTPPIAHSRPLRVLADDSLRRHDVVWAAAGTPTTVFPVGCDRIVTLARGHWVDVAAN